MPSEKSDKKVCCVNSSSSLHHRPFYIICDVIFETSSLVYAQMSPLLQLPLSSPVTRRVQSLAPLCVSPTHERPATLTLSYAISLRRWRHVSLQLLWFFELVTNSTFCLAVTTLKEGKNKTKKTQEIFHNKENKNTSHFYTRSLQTLYSYFNLSSPIGTSFSTFSSTLPYHALPIWYLSNLCLSFSLLSIYHQSTFNIIYFPAPLLVQPFFTQTAF